MEENVEVEVVAEQAQNQKNERGASLVEYGLLVALIAVICIAAVKLLGTNVSTGFSQIASGV